MGDRGNIVIKYDVKDDGKGKLAAEPAEIFLYTHWGGTDIAVILHRALSRRQRWTDDSYLTRIIFCELVAGSEGDETGYGIAPYQPDNEHDLLVVDCKAQTVTQESREGREHKTTWTFEEFVAMEPEKIEV